VGIAVKVMGAQWWNDSCRGGSGDVVVIVVAAVLKHGSGDGIGSSDGLQHSGHNPNVTTATWY